MLRSTLQSLLEESQKIEKDLKDLGGQLSHAYETDGYWHDNPGWQHLMHRQQMFVNRLSEIGMLLKNPTLIEDLSIDGRTVRVGTCVKVVDISTQEQKIEKYKIVGPADISYNPICREGDEEDKNSDEFFASCEAPLVQPLLGKSVNDIVTVKLPTGKTRTLKIIEITLLRQT